MQPILSAYRAHQKSLGLSPTGIRIERRFVSEEERLELVDWAMRMRPHLKGNGASRQFRQTDTLPDAPEVYTTMRQRLERTLRLAGAEREPMFGWYLSIIDEGGAVHGHLDPTRPGRRHLRCNVFLQTPEAGGMPVVEGEVHEVGDGDLLAFFPSEKRHRSEAVHGGLARVICSFGYLVPLDYRLPPQPVRSAERHGGRVSDRMSA